MEPWFSFYRPHFPSDSAAEQFVEACENLEPSRANHVAKIMMHQAQRLVSIVDDLPRFRPHQEPLQVLFLLMCVENISKLHDGFSGEGKSRHYVRKFFATFLSKANKEAISFGFTVNADRLPHLGFSKSVDLLYDIRCDVVHEGNYRLCISRRTNVNVNTNPDVIVEIRFARIRDIVVEGCINAIKDKLDNS
jgi:hypothetical protein